jgi:hypothetical protein
MEFAWKHVIYEHDGSSVLSFGMRSTFRIDKGVTTVVKKKLYRIYIIKNTCNLNGIVPVWIDFDNSGAVSQEESNSFKFGRFML